MHGTGRIKYAGIGVILISVLTLLSLNIGCATANQAKSESKSDIKFLEFYNPY